METEVYTLRTSSWRQISILPPCLLRGRRSADDWVIISFDFKQEEFKETPHPNIGLEFSERAKLINLRET